MNDKSSVRPFNLRNSTLNHNIIFQKINFHDLATVHDIEEQCYPNPWPLKIMADCIKADYQCIKGLSELSPDILCYAFMMIGHEEAHLLKITVHPDYQKKGLGQAMLQRLILISRINHARKIWLEVMVSNESAIRFYRQAGFENQTIRKNYYTYQDEQGETINEDALVMCYCLLT